MQAPDSATPAPFTLASQRLGALPVVNHFLARMGMAGHLDACLPACG